MITRAPARPEVGEKRLTEVISEISISFIDLPANAFDDSVTEALRRVAQLIQSDRASLAQVDESGIVQLTHFWNAGGIPPPLEMYDENQFPWISSRLRRGEPVWFERVEEVPEDAPDRGLLEIEGIKSLLALPLISQGLWIGVLALEDMTQERLWPRHLRDQLGLLANIFSYGLERKVTEIKRRTAFEDLLRLKDQVEMGNRWLRKKLQMEDVFDQIVGRSAQLRRILALVEKVAPTDSAVLILGETGTGKELVANAIHAMSSRGERPMITVNCASLPSTLVESELFGREKGAYTGALNRQAGRFESADGSTLLLDEIGDLSLELQSKLLRVLEEGEFERLGSSKTIRVDVRVIAATNRDLTALVKEGAFRKDLFFRLNVFPITVPPLRERPDDIPALVWAFVDEFGPAIGRSIESIPETTMARLVAYPWPGNVRELRNVIERAMILSSEGVLEVDIPLGPAPDHKAAQTLDEVQREQILRVLEHTGWRIRGNGGAAEILDILPTTLESRMKRLGILRRSSQARS
ncbi:MAG TPA: sigma 54-interacting transcriptional regulator [Gemmatimonadota bacterium]|nr:sigma 54-interacting transcriptional regulator [Gemmatimonadota bacterium]